MHVPGAFEQTGWINSPPPFTSEIDYTVNDKPTLTIYSGSNFLYQRLKRYTVRVRACQQPTNTQLGDICSDLVKTFELEDVNNMAPQFIDQASLSEVLLSEQSQKGTEVVKLFAVDLDPNPDFNKASLSLPKVSGLHSVVERVLVYCNLAAVWLLALTGPRTGQRGGQVSHLHTLETLPTHYTLSPSL